MSLPRLSPEFVRSLLAGKLPGGTIAGLVGCRVLSASSGKLLASFKARITVHESVVAAPAGLAGTLRFACRFTPLAPSWRNDRKRRVIVQVGRGSMLWLSAGPIPLPKGASLSFPDPLLELTA